MASRVKKICLVVGTRPEAIKMAPVIKELKRFPSRYDAVVLSTGQHDSMLNQAFAVFDIVPDINLKVMKPGQPLTELSSKLLDGLNKAFQDINPDLILVHGDTTSALVASQVGFYNAIKVGHVEAGLRSGSVFSPFPEEYNRRAISLVSDYHFAPTKQAAKCLLSEGINETSIVKTGNTVIDALLLTLNRIEENKSLRRRLKSSLNMLLQFDLETDRFILITTHRRENIGDGITNICDAIADLANVNPSFYFVLAVHLNPAFKNLIEERLSGISNIRLIPPQDYYTFVWLLKECYLALTDSGGIQEEAPAFGKPVLVMRDTTERPEAIDAGVAKLVTARADVIIKETQLLIDDYSSYTSMVCASNPFGDGKAAQRIERFLRNAY
jgi:UDP-N-acetylglucosamine 2-epimerase (non-hydrolysing)